MASVDGVSTSTVNLASEQATIVLHKPVPHAVLVEATEDAGYEVPRRRLDLAVEGMTCASCVARVENALLSVPGVTGASVNFASERATVSAGAEVLATDLKKALAAARYTARAVEGTDHGEAHAIRKQPSRRRSPARSSLPRP